MTVETLENYIPVNWDTKCNRKVFPDLSFTSFPIITHDLGVGEITGAPTQFISLVKGGHDSYKLLHQLIFSSCCTLELSGTRNTA